MRQELQHEVPTVRGPVPQPELDGVTLGPAEPCLAAQSGGRQPVPVSEHLVEAAQAAKARGMGHVRHRQARVGQEALGQQEPAGLAVLDGAHVVGVLEDAAQMAVGTGQVTSDIRDASMGTAVPLDVPCCGASQRCRGVHGCAPGRQLGPAQQAWPETGLFGLGRRGVEGAVGRERLARPAHWTAVDAGRDDPDEEPPVEAGIPGQQGLIQRVVVQIRHGPPPKRSKHGIAVSRSPAVFGHRYPVLDVSVPWNRVHRLTSAVVAIAPGLP